MVRSSCETRTAFEHFACLGVHIIPEIVGFVADRNVEIVADSDSPAIILAIIDLPLYGGNKRGRVGAGLYVSRNIQPDLDVLPTPTTTRGTNEENLLNEL